MAKEYKIGTLFGLSLSLVPSFFIGTVFLWVILGGVAYPVCISGQFRRDDARGVFTLRVYRWQHLIGVVGKGLAR